MEHAFIKSNDNQKTFCLNKLKKAPENLDLGQIIINSYDSILVTDKFGKVLLVNNATGRLLGVDPGELIGQNVKDFVKTGLYDHSTAMESIEKRSVITGLIKVWNGVNLMSTSTPLLDEHGEVVLVITNTRDNDLVTKYVAALEEERTKADRYKTAVKYLSEGDLEQKKLVAESRQMRQIITTANVIAKADSTVMILGESGTGKEVIARFIHRHSFRCKEPFIPVNCAAIPQELLESEFFGYVKGAFTGASSQGKAGLFEIADRGTLFLDEIAELPLAMQSKLLRVLENGEFQRLGSTTINRTNVRLITATNRDLKAMVNQKLFRNDLYYRLNVIPLILPPLRERPEDIIGLANNFLQELNKKYAYNKRFTIQTIKAFLNYNWPGNVRELRNVIERMVITSTCDDLQFEENNNLVSGKTRPGYTDLIQEIPSKGYSGPLKSVLKAVEEQYIDQVLTECNGRVGEAAKRLGIHRTMLYRKMANNKNLER